MYQFNRKQFGLRNKMTQKQSTDELARLMDYMSKSFPVCGWIACYLVGSKKPVVVFSLN